jgi:WD40 repeat protein
MFIPVIPSTEITPRKRERRDSSPVTSPPDHSMAVRSLTWSPDSKELLDASDDGHVNIYDVYLML